jgi:hypothetical protein
VQPALQLVGGQQQAGFGVGHALEQADAAQHAVKRLQAVPTVIGGVQRAHGGIAAQCGQDLIESLFGKRTLIRRY